jgi:Apolipoprotein N-acyltransferase
MDIIMQEAKKCLVKKHMIVLWMILLAMKFFYGMELQGESRFISSDLEECKASYMTYINRWQGKLTDTKKEEIEKYLNTYHDKADSVSRLGDAEYRKEISRKKYIEELVSFQESYGDEKAVSILENQYNYIMENRDSKYFVYYNGWVNFFRGLGQDIFLLALAVPAFVLLCCREYESGMNILNRTTKRGRKMLYWNKVFVGVIFSALFTCSFYIVDLCASQSLYGLEGWGYPIQSIHIFADCPWRISIGEMVILSVLLLILGTIYLSAITFVCAAIMKKVIPVGVVALSILLLPIFLFGDGVYRMPLPTGFFQLQGYILGNYNVERRQVEYMAWKELLRVIGLSVVVIAVCYGFSYILYQEKKFLIRKGKIFALGIMLAAFAISGCDKGNSVFGGDKAIYNNIGFGYLAVSDDYAVDICDQAMLHAEEGDQALFRDPFHKYNRERISIGNIVGDVFYYIYMSSDDSLSEFEIHALNLKTLDDRIVYEDKKYEIKGVPYLGIGDNEEKIVMEAYSGDHALSNWWVAEKEIILVRNHSVYSVDLKSGKKKLIIKEAEGDIFSYAGRTIYYVDTAYALKSYFLDAGKEKTICSSLVSQICASDQSLTYQTMDGKICEYCYADGITEELGANQDGMIYADASYTYFKGEQSCYRVEKRMGKREVVCSGRDVTEVMSSGDGKVVYVVELDGEEESLRIVK